MNRTIMFQLELFECEVPAARQFEYHKLSFRDGFQAKVGGLNMPKSGTVVGDKTSLCFGQSSDVLHF